MANKNTARDLSGAGEYHLPEQGFPAWLKVFDANNNEHDCDIAALRRVFTQLGKAPPPTWQGKGTLKVLELAPGDGRFTRRMLDELKAKTEKDIDYFGIELNPDSVAAANTRIPEGTVVVGDIHKDDLKRKLPQDFEPDIIIVSHAIYFTHDKPQFLRDVAALAGADTAMMHIMNTPLSSKVADDMGEFNAALGRSGYVHYDSPNFASRITMPAQDPIKHIERFRTNPSQDGLDEEGRAMFGMLSFMQQRALDEVSPQQRNELLDEVAAKLRTNNNTVQLGNQISFVLHKDASPAVKMAYNLAAAQARETKLA